MVPTAGEPLEFVKKGDAWTYLPDPYLQVDAAKVRQWLISLATAKAVRYVSHDAASLAEAGLDQPRYQAEVTLEDGRTIRLIVGEPADSGRHLATVAGTGAIFELAAPTAAQLQRPLTFFKVATVNK